jgi:hypothetical protein
MPETKDSGKSGRQSQNNVTTRAPNIIGRIGPRSIVLVGLILAYGILMVGVPASDPKALVGLLILAIFLFVAVRADSGFLKMVKDTRTTVGLVLGALGFGVGVYALVINLLAFSLYDLLIAIVFLVFSAPLFFYKLSVALRKGLDYVNPMLMAGLIIALLSTAFFLLSNSPTLSLIAFILIVVGMVMRGNGAGRERRKAELERIAPPS